MSSTFVSDSDPRLKEAMAEIEGILAKYEIAGAVQLASSTHAEFKIHFPEWSAVQLQERPDKSDVEIRIKSSSERDGQGHLESSMHLLLSIRDMASAHAGYLHHLSEYVVKTLRDEGVEVEHKTLTEQVAEDRDAEAKT